MKIEIKSVPSMRPGQAFLKAVRKVCSQLQLQDWEKGFNYKD